jgi:hypothetical protein
MTRDRDSDDDLRKVLPDLATLNREADPTRRRAKLQDAMDNPQVDAALVLMRPGLKPGEDPLYYQVPRRAEGEAPPGPSPWEAARSDVPAVALPSSHAPGAAPPVTVARPLPEPQRPQSALRRSAPIAILAVFIPLVLMWYLFVRQRTPVVQGAPHEVTSGASAVSAAPAVPLAPSSVATPPSSAAVPSPSPPVPLSAIGDAGAASSAPVSPAPKSMAPKVRVPKAGSGPGPDTDPELIQ